MESDITQLAKRMCDRRAEGGAPYVLLLGSSLSLTSEVCRAVCGDDDWETFWTAVEKMSPQERRAAFKRPLERLLLAEGYRALTRLLAAGYFEVVFTLNVDDTLDDELRVLKADEYRIWVYGEVTSAELVAALEYRNPRVKVLKLRGDVNAHKLPLTPEGHFEFPRELENAVTQWLSRDTMAVGDLLFDYDVWLRCLRPGEGALWIVQTSEDSETSEVLRRVKQVRQRGGVITVESFNAFFTALADALEVEEVRPDWELPPQNPYQGLEAFTQDKARFFFGRERLTDKLVERLRRERFLAVVGASGSGKSSVVQAGLLHRLAQGALPGSAAWPTVVCRPGELEDVLAQLLRGTEGITTTERRELLGRVPADETAIHAIAERVLRDAPPDHQLVLVVDQFEELFTLESAAYREQLIAALLYAVRVTGGRTRVVVTMRSDFYARAAEYDELFVWMEQHRVFVPPMGETELREAIQRPARLVKFPLDEALAETILKDAGQKPGALPMLQYALKELYDRWQEGLTPSQVYGEIGGVQGALEHRADEVYQSLSDRQQAVAQHILIRLTQLGEGTEDTQRRATFEDLATSTITLDEIEEVVDILAAAQTCLVVTDDPDKEQPGQARVVEVAHEALIRGWKRLQDWLNEDRAGLLRQRLGERARQWEVAGRHEDHLYRGLELGKARQWAEAHEGEQFPEPRPEQDEGPVERSSELEQVFLDMSTALDQAEAERDRAEQQVRRARSGQLAAQSQLASDRWKDRASSLPLILAREAVLTTWAVDGYVTTEADAALRQAVDAVSPWCLTLPWHRHTDVVSSAAFSPDGKMIVTASWDQTARLWDVETGEQICLLASHTAWINSAAFSPDGKTVATASGDAVRLWDVSAALNTGVETGAGIRTLKGHTNIVLSAAFSPDGKTIVTASRDQTARLWDVKTGTVIRTLKGHTGPVLSAAFSPDGKTIVTASGDAVRLWDVETGAIIRTLKGHTGWIRSAAFSPDGKTIVTASGDAAWLWDVETGAFIRTLKSDMDVVWSAAFSPDGKTIVTASGRTARLWDVSAALNTGVETGAEIRTLKGHADIVLSAAFSPDGKTIVTASGDRSAWLWDAKTGGVIRTLAGHTDSVWSAAFSPDGKTIVSASDDHTARLWDVETGAVIHTLKGHTGPVLSAAFSPDGKTVVTTSWDQTARLWDVAAALNPGVETGPLIRTLKGHTAGVNSGAFSPDGKTIVTASDDHTARLWDVAAALNPGVETGVEICTLEGHTAGVWSAAFSPDGQTIVTASQDQTVRLWDVSAVLNTGAETGAEIRILKGHAVWVNSAAFSPDGKTIVTANDDGTARLWDVSAALNTGVETEAEIRILAGHTDRVNSAVFSPDGKTIVTASGDKTARLWDVAAALNPGVETGAVIRILEGHTEGVNSAAFSPDGKTIVTASWDKTIRLWPSIEDLLALAESLIQREPPTLTPEERRRFGLE